jgi:DNA-binding MarR family transcriptional regulator
MAMQQQVNLLNNPPTPLPGSVHDWKPGRQAAGPAAIGLPQRLNTAVERLSNHRQNGAAPGEATPSSLATLAVLAAAVPLRISDLAARAAVGMPAMSRVVDYLDRHGWAARHPDPTDHRACLVSITQAGTELLDTVRRERSGRLSAGLTRLPPQQIDALLAALPALESLADHITTA